MNNRQFIPKVTPQMLKQLPDQFCSIINRMIDEINKEK